MSATRAQLPASTGRWHLPALLIVLALGIAARFDRLDVSPPGLYYDEAYYALDAVSVREGARPIYFEANNGREPLFIYSVALSQLWFGDTVYAVRVVAAIYGALALLAGYGAARGLFGPRIALLATALHAGSLWAITFSRIGLRVTTLPLVVGLLLLALAYGWRLRRRGLIAVGGALLGLCFYTYIAARLIPLVFIGLALFWWIFRRSTFPRWDWLAAFVVPAAIVAAPMGVYAVTHVDVYLGRAAQVVLPLSDVLVNAARVAGMFFWRGDSNWRHNLPGRPVFDPLTALAFVAGLAWLGWRVWRSRDLRAALLLIWLVALAAPTALSDRAPHFLRALGLTPVIYIVAALALEPVEAALVRRRRPLIWGGVLAVAVAVVHAGATIGALQAVAASTGPRFAFETAAVELAEAAAACRREPDTAAWVDERLWARHPAIRYLAPGSTPFNLEQGVPDAAPARACVFTPADASVTAVVGHWAGPVRINAERGGLDQTEGAPAPYPLYNILRLAPLQAVEPRATYPAGLELRVAEAAPTETGMTVRLVWTTSTPLPPGLHRFVHWRIGDRMLAQSDGPVGGELLPAEAWRPGDQVEQILHLDAEGAAGAVVTVGVYDFGSGDRLVTDTGLDHLSIWP